MTLPAGRLVREDLVDADGDALWLVVGRCRVCGERRFPVGPTCLYCGSPCVRDRLAGRATVRWATVVRFAPPGYAGAVPYGFGVVEMDGGLRVVARLLPADPSRLRAGALAELVLDAVGSDDDGAACLTYAFRVADAGKGE